MEKKNILPIILATVAVPTCYGLYALDKEADFNRRLLSDSEREIGNLRGNTKTMITQNFSVYEEGKKSKLPTLLEYTDTPLPLILEINDAQKALGICEETRKKCAAQIHGKIPPPADTFMKQLKLHFNARSARKNVQALAHCEKALNTCVKRKVLPHRKTQ